MLLIGKWLRRGERNRWCARATPKYVIRRSPFGWLTIRFVGGPVYPNMLDDLRRVYRRCGHLVLSGEELSGQGWIERIVTAGAGLSAEELHAIKTLLPTPDGAAQALVAAQTKIKPR